jgi:alanyl aminopeptidase
MRRAPVSFLVVAALASSVSCLAALVAQAEVRLGRDVVPTSQAIRLHMDADQTDYTGSVNVQLQVVKATKTIQFHARDIALDKIVLTQKGKTIAAEAGKADEHGLVTLTAASALAPGTAKLAIDFHQKFNTSAVSIYRMDYEGHGYVFAQFESDDARGGFPCWDEPSFKIPYQFTLEVPAAHMAVCNTPIQSESAVKDGWKTVVFKPTPPMPSYLLTVASGPLEAVPIPGLSVPGRVITCKGQSQLAGLAIELAPPTLKALETYFGTPYPYEKLDLIAVPEYWAGAMENPGAITYRDNALLIDPKAASALQRQTLARFMRTSSRTCGSAIG